ncbi:hypothetical protein APE_0283.1 [Aeropyrum pernix K1]|uniref:Uncharacterized protein n=1 Tax=Aeropyrum pernix (strain ATCC 700893 / DSM 11879 / JCM 9820 / NBRC 100138 / K1) TaxID=272557 RepID=Q9YFF9_AERPE|nr:hypothetical protein [Aeropyrum pernix]BAA79237.2 hypothetical protein APE_0283.1 [Aeropyrum pernix K1]
MSRELIGLGAGILIRLLLKNLKKKGQHIEERAPPQLTREQIDQYIVDTTIDEAYEQLQAEYDRAYRELLKREKEAEDPHIKKLIQNIKEYHELFRKDNEMRPPWMLTAILLNEALKHGVKDRDKIYQYILKASWEYAKEIAQALPAKKYQGRYTRAYADQMRNPFISIIEIEAMIREANRDDPKWKKYTQMFDLYWNKIPDDIYNRADSQHHEVTKYLQLLEEALREAERESGVEPFWHKTPEEILGIGPGEGPAPAGEPILAYPDRYPTLAQKVLLKTLVLGEFLREGGGVHRDLYRALRNLLDSPLTTNHWYPFLAEWFENLEKGRHVSPLTQLLQKLPVNPELKQRAYRYLAQIEQGKSISEIPEEERKAFREVIERLKNEIWRNPDRFVPIVEELTYATGMNIKDAAKTLIGVLDDFAKIYSGEKSPRQAGIERDATQVLHVIKNLRDRGNYVDPYHVTETLINIIEQHIQDPLLREAYKRILEHYQRTHGEIPRDLRYLERVVEEERELEEKLKGLERENRKLSEGDIRRTAMLYRTLMLLTPHPSLEDIKRFYSRLAERLKVKVGEESFLPVHGPVAEDVASSFAAIRRAKPEERERVVRREISGFEPLFHAAPHIKEGVMSVLAATRSNIVSGEKHEEFIRHLERTQVRRPLE